MRYTVYRITNQLSGRFYIGVHKTNDPGDGYMGSGLVIRRAIAKHGRENFSKEILAVFETSAEALAHEKAVLEACRAETLCYNIHEGGLGGFDQINSRGLNNKNNNHKCATEARILKIKSDPAFRQRYRENGRKTIAKARLHPNWGGNLKEAQEKSVAAWKGKKHTAEARKKMSEAKRGDRHNCYGLRWMRTEDGQSERVAPGDIAERFAQGWIFGRKCPRRKAA